MVPNATKYDMEKQFQTIYTISKFKEFLDEITGKVYYDVISTSARHCETTYEVLEDVIYDEQVTRKKYSVSFEAGNCHIVCSYHLFEFQEILRRHAISVLIRNHFTILPARYILRRWRKDITRAHTRVAVHYEGLVSMHGQLRYDRMCEAFVVLVDIAAYDKERTRETVEWIGFQCKQIRTTKSSFRSNLLATQTMHLSSQSMTLHDTGSGSVQDPKCSNRNGTPRKLQKKCPLESSLRKNKG